VAWDSARARRWRWPSSSQEVVHDRRQLHGPSAQHHEGQQAAGEAVVPAEDVLQEVEAPDGRKGGVGQGVAQPAVAVDGAGSDEQLVLHRFEDTLGPGHREEGGGVAFGPRRAVGGRGAR
jgi:hypothetical protein